MMKLTPKQVAAPQNQVKKTPVKAGNTSPLIMAQTDGVQTMTMNGKTITTSDILTVNANGLQQAPKASAPPVPPAASNSPIVASVAPPAGRGVNSHNNEYNAGRVVQSNPIANAYADNWTPQTGKSPNVNASLSSPAHDRQYTQDKTYKYDSSESTQGIVGQAYSVLDETNAMMTKYKGGVTEPKEQASAPNKESATSEKAHSTNEPPQKYFTHQDYTKSDNTYTPFKPNTNQLSSSDSAVGSKGYRDTKARNSSTPASSDASYSGGKDLNNWNTWWGNAPAGADPFARSDYLSGRREVPTTEKAVPPVTTPTTEKAVPPVTTPTTDKTVTPSTTPTTDKTVTPSTTPTIDKTEASGSTPGIETTDKTGATPPATGNEQTGTTSIDSMLATMNLNDQQAESLSSCFIHAGINSIAKASRDDDPQGKLRAVVNKAIQHDPATGDFNFTWADGQKMTITSGEMKQWTNDKYNGDEPRMNDLSQATEMAWFRRHPDQQKTGGFAHEFYNEMFGLESNYAFSSPESINMAKQKGVVSVLSGTSNVNTFHAWSLDYEEGTKTWDMNNSDIDGGFKHLPQTKGMPNVDLTDQQLKDTILADRDSYISYFKIPQ